jgi:hypothetical protein
MTDKFSTRENKCQKNNIFGYNGSGAFTWKKLQSMNIYRNDKGKMKLGLRSGQKTLEFGEGKQEGWWFHISIFPELR